MKKLVKFLIACLAVAAIVCLAACGKQKPQSAPEASSASSEEEEVSAEPEQQAEQEETENLKGSQDIAFFGVDTRGTNLGKGTRSDSIMIAHIDHDAKTIRVASIYRDCMVNISNHGYEKITHAHSYGGPDLAVSTINENFDLDIEDYITVNFINVADFVDDIGGLEQEITSDEADVINSYIDELNGIRGTSSAYITEAGTYTLDGTQAVAFSRIRYTSGGDYKRSERQRTVLFGMFEKLKGMDLVTRVSVAEDMASQINTSLSTSEVTELMTSIAGYEITEMTAYPQVFYSGKVDGAWVEVPVTLVDMASGLHEFLYGDTSYEPSETVTSYSADLSTKASTANNDLRETTEETE